MPIVWSWWWWVRRAVVIVLGSVVSDEVDGWRERPARRLVFQIGKPMPVSIRRFVREVGWERR